MDSEATGLPADREQPPRGWKAIFATIWTGQAFSLMGSQVAQFALVWWLTRTTGSATVLATATLVALVPGIVLGPLSGALVDRWNRRLIMMCADSCAALVAAWLAYLFWSGSLQVWHVYIVMFVRSIAGGFHWPAMQASTSLLVPKEQLSRVAGLNQTLFGAMSIAAPPLGALLLELLPLHGMMAIDVVTATIAVSTMAAVHIPQPRRAEPASASPSSVWQDLHEGLRYVRGWPGMMALMVLAALISFLIVPAFSLVPVLVTRHYGGQALELGWINSAWGIGSLLGGLALSAWGGFRRRIVTSLVGLMGIGAGMLVVGFSPAPGLWLGLSGMFVAGFMMPIANGPFMAAIQTVVAPGMQGRVFTLLGSASSLMAPLSLAIAGPVADAFGVQVWYIVGGVASLVIGAGSFMVRPLMGIEDGARGSTPVSAAQPGEAVPAATPGSRAQPSAPWPV